MAAPAATLVLRFEDLDTRPTGPLLRLLTALLETSLKSNALRVSQGSVPGALLIWWEREHECKGTQPGRAIAEGRGVVVGVYHNGRISLVFLELIVTVYVKGSQTSSPLVKISLPHVCRC